MLDLLVIHPSGQAQIYQSLAREMTAVEPPLWAAMIAEYVRQHGYLVSILDANAENLAPEEIAQQVAAQKPHLVSVVVYGHNPSGSTQHMSAAGAICRAIKEVNPDQKILMLGGHAAALPERTLREEACDFVSSGEGPKTVVGLLEALKSGSNNFSKVPDLWYGKISSSLRGGEADAAISEILDCFDPLRGSRNDMTTHFTFPASLISDLDAEMPEPAWDLLPMDRYRAHNWHAFGFSSRQPYASIYTTLGCPYHCSFCCIQAPFKSGEKAAGMSPQVSSYRFWSPERIIQTIDHLVTKYQVRHLKFADEMFVLNENHVSEICRKLIDRNYGLNLWAYARVDTIKAPQLDLLKRAGFNWLALGIESANPKVLKDVLKPYDTESTEKVIRQIQDAGIHVIANYIFGLPEDNFETMQATLNLAMELHTEFANFYCTMAYPGSAIYERAVLEKGALPKSWSGYSQHSADSFPLATRYLSSREVLEFRDQAFQRYFSRPEYQNRIERLFGLAARKEIEKMLAVPLPRDSVKVEDGQPGPLHAA